MNRHTIGYVDCLKAARFSFLCLHPRSYGDDGEKVPPRNAVRKPGQHGENATERVDIPPEIRYTCTRVPKGHGVMVTRGSPKPLLRVRVLLPLPLWVALIRSGGSLFLFLRFYVNRNDDHSNADEMLTESGLVGESKKILSRINFWVDFMKHVCYTFSRWFFC